MRCAFCSAILARHWLQARAGSPPFCARSWLISVWRTELSYAPLDGAAPRVVCTACAGSASANQRPTAVIDATGGESRKYRPTVVQRESGRHACVASRRIDAVGSFSCLDRQQISTGSGGAKESFVDRLVLATSEQSDVTGAPARGRGIRGRTAAEAVPPDPAHTVEPHVVDGIIATEGEDIEPACSPGRHPGR